MPKIIFCEECNNICYPQMDNNQTSLIYLCMSCDFQSQETENIAYYNQISHVPTEEKMLVPELGADATLPRNTTKKCPKCNAEEPVFFMSSSKHKESKMMHYYVCRKVACGYRWHPKKRVNNNVEELKARMRKNRGEDIF